MYSELIGNYKKYRIKSLYGNKLTINSPSNMIRQFTNNLKEAGMILGQLFIPLLQKVLPILNGVMIALKRLMVTIANFFGIKLDLEGFGQGFSGLEDDIGGVGDSLDDATDSAKKLKKQLAGFDELENLSSQTGQKTSVGGTGIDLTSEILKATEEYEKAFNEAMERMENKAQEWADRIVEFFTTGNVPAKISKALTDALNSIDWKSIYSFAEKFGKGLADALNSFITPDLFGAVGRTIAGAINTVSYAVLSFAENFDWKNFGNSLAMGINEYFSAYDAKAAAKAICTWIKGALDLVITFLKKTDFEAIGKKIGEFLVELDFTEILGKLASAIWEAIKAAFKLVGGLFEEAPLETALITAFAVLKFTNLGSFIGGKIATAIATKLGVAGTYTSVTTALSAGLSKALASVGGIAGLLTTDVAVIAGAGTFAEIGLTIATGVIGGVVAAFGGWHIGQFLYEKFSGEVIEMSWEEQFGEIFKSFTDGTWTDALTLWGKDIRDAFIQIGADIEAWVINTYDTVAQIISDWWENDVSPWFTSEKWAELWEIVKDTASEMWDNFVDWWSNTAIGQWWENDVTPWFTKEKWLGIISGIFPAFEDTFNNIKSFIDGIIEGIVNTIDKLFGDIASKTSALTGSIGDTLGGIIGGTTKSTIPQFATGGFPQQYSLFMAGENGVPELAGTVGGKTAVAGGAEITGIRQEIRATANEEMALLRQQNSLLQAILEKEFGISQDALFSSVRNSANDYHRRTGNFAFDI